MSQLAILDPVTDSWQLDAAFYDLQIQRCKWCGDQVSVDIAGSSYCSHCQEHGFPTTEHKPGYLQVVPAHADDHERKPCDRSAGCLHRVCHECERPLRKAAGDSEDDHPGTRRGLGLEKPTAHCTACRERLNRARKDAFKQYAVRACANCSEPMRPSGVKAAEIPGTVLHYGHGRCVNCARNPERVVQQPDHVPFTSDQLSRLAATDKGLYNYVLSRRGHAQPANRLKHG